MRAHHFTKRRSCALAHMAGALLVIISVSESLAASELARQYCGASPDTPQKLASGELTTRIAETFGLDVGMARGGSFYRCVSGRLLVCTVGANLPCGKANLATSMKEASAYCSRNPNALNIPMAVTGHDTVWSWRCAGTTAQAEGPLQKIDPQGYFEENWKEL